MLRRLTVVIALVLAAVVSLASPALAHVELEPSEATAGATETLTFNVAYEGSATTGLDVKLPDGASVVEVPDKAGWTSSTDDAANTVTWSGGSVEADETFSVVVALPTTPGEVLFPAVQTTTDGDVSWIEEDAAEGHDNHPAPRLTLVADPNATTTTAPSTTATAAATSTTADLPGTTVEAANEGDGDSAAPWLIGAGIAAILVIAIGGYLLKRRADADKANEAPAEPSAPDEGTPTNPS
jgi:periplasmic copper chaperone A